MTIAKRIILIGVLLLSALLVVVFLLLKFTDFNRYKPLIQAQITNSLGRTLSINGDIQLDIGFNSRLVANHIQPVSYTHLTLPTTSRV